MTKSIKTESRKAALGYLRISDKKQIEGESRNNQQDQIQRYADANNIEIIEWFYDEAKSGKNTDRFELQNLLKMALRSKNEISYIIVYKMNRASRDIDSYITNVRSILSSRGIQIRSATEQFDDSPSGRFMESMHVLVGQLDNDNKRETTVDNMRRLAKQGWWQHGPPRGYEMNYIKNSEGKSRPTLKPDNEKPLISNVLSRFSQGDICLADLCRYATSIGLLNYRGKPVSQEALTKIVKRPEYAGYVCDKFTDFELVEGKHPALISKSTYWTNQECLKRKSKAYLIGLKHNEINRLTPLSRFMKCSSCSKQMTRSNPGGNYRYYCARNSCRGTGTIKASEAHLKFAELLHGVTPKQNALKLMKKIIVRTASKEMGNYTKDLSIFQNEQASIESTRSNTIKKYVNGQLSNEEKQLMIDQLDVEKLEVSQQISNLEEQKRVSTTSIENAVSLMENIATQWLEAPFETKQSFQNLIFPDGFLYDIQNNNFIIKKISALYGAINTDIGQKNKQNSMLVTLQGIEP